MSNIDRSGVKHIKLHGCYFVLDKDLGINTENLGHDVFVIKFSKDKKRVKVKTVTSLERKFLENGKRVFKKNNKNHNFVEEIHNGEIIVVPKRDIGTDYLSGIVNKGIWIRKEKLLESKYNLKYPIRFNTVIGK